MTGENPFPQLAVARGTLAGVPDYESPLLFSARRVIESWQQEMATASPIRDSALLPRGLVMSVRGRFGSGKTHLVLQIMREFESITAKYTPTSRVTSKQMFVQADTLDPESFYRDVIAGRLADEEFENLIGRFVQQLVLEKTSGATPDSLGKAGAARAMNAYATEPRFVFDLLRANLLPVTGIQEGLRQRFEEIRSAVKPVNSSAPVTEDYTRAYESILNETLGAPARRWIRGQEISPEESVQLGLSERAIRGKTDPQDALQFLLRAFREAGYVWLLCLDEIERFVLAGAETRRSEQLTLLKTLVEMVIGAGHAILVSGSEDAWEALRYRRDVSDRFPEATVVRVVLDERECRELLGVYLKRVSRSLGDTFGSDAVAALLHAGEFNARRILSLGHDAFAEERGDRISVATIESLVTRGDILKRWAEAANEAATVIVEEAALRGWSVEHNITLVGATFDFAISRPNNAPRLVVQIIRTAFRGDEIATARQLAQKARHSAQQSETLICIVVVGYSTQRVREELSQAVAGVILYNAQTFRQDFDAVLEDAAKDAGRGPAERPFEQVETNLTSIERQVGVDLKKLGVEVAALNRSKTDAFDRETQVAIAERFAEMLIDLEDNLRHSKISTTSSSDLEETLRKLTELNRLLPGQHSVERLLKRTKELLASKPSDGGAPTFVIREIARQHAQRSAALQRTTWAAGIYRFEHLALLARIALVAGVSAGLALIIWTAASLPDADHFAAYKQKIAPLYQVLNERLRDQLPTQMKLIDAAAWEAGIQGDSVYHVLYTRLSGILEGFSESESYQTALNALDQARSESRVYIAIRKTFSQPVGNLLLFVLLLSLLYPLASFAMRWFARRRYLR